MEKARVQGANGSREYYEMAIDGMHLFNVGAEFAESFVRRHSLASDSIERTIASRKLEPADAALYRDMIRDYREHVMGNRKPASMDPTKLRDEESVFRFGTEVAVLRKSGKFYSLHFGPKDTPHIELSARKAAILLQELSGLERSFRRANAKLRKAMVENAQIGGSLHDFLSARRRCEEFKNRLVVDAMTHEGRAKPGRAPEMRLLSLH